MEICFSVKKKKERLKFIDMWLELEKFTPTEVTQSISA